MAWFQRLLFEPWFKLIYGPPAEEGPPLDLPGNGAAKALARASPADTYPACRGLLLLADGVGGFDLCGTSLRYVIGAERLPYGVQVVNWGHGLGRWYADLSNVANRDLRARQVAQAVRRFHASQPDDPVFLVAKSGGCGVMTRALELLADCPVEAAVFLAPALSPRYDLSAALLGVRGNLHVFWSPMDVIILGAGTRVFGTVDRVWTCGAGLVGFRTPRPAETNAERVRLYARLKQVRWTPRMAACGYLGGHFGPDSPAFLRRYVVPLLRAKPAASS